jgi:hypothetical protein
MEWQKQMYWVLHGMPSHGFAFLHGHAADSFVVLATTDEEMAMDNIILFSIWVKCSFRRLLASGKVILCLRCFPRLE